MDGERFDSLSRALSRGTLSRRDACRRLVAAGVLGWGARSEDAAAKKRKKKKKRKKHPPISCTSQCGSHTCGGDDGCGHSCGTCQNGFTCSNSAYGGICQCAGPICDGVCCNSDQFCAAGACGKYELAANWGELGNWEGQFYEPQGVAVDGDGHVFVADTKNQRVQKFAPNPQVPAQYDFLNEWGTEGDGDGEFASPVGIAVDDSGQVYVVDGGNQRIQKFDNEGNFLATWGSFGHEDGQFYFPYGIAVDRQGSVYVVDRGNSRIQKFAPHAHDPNQYDFVKSWPSAFEAPTGIAVDSHGKVFVADSSRYHIQKFSDDGTPLATWGGVGSGNGQFDLPEGIAVDRDGNVFVADTYNNRIQKLSNDGNFIVKWGSRGEDPGQFHYPYAVAVDGDGNVFVADQENDRIQKFAVASGAARLSAASRSRTGHRRHSHTKRGGGHR